MRSPDDYRNLLDRVLIAVSRACCLRLAALGLLLGWGVSLSADHFVAQNGQTPDPAGLYGSWETAASNIQEAVSIALSGSNVWVGKGVYSALPGSNNVVWITNSVALRAVGAPGEVAIDGGGANRGLGIELSGQNLRVVVDGFTVTNCVASTGAGMNIVYDSGVSGRCEILNCAISNNSTSAASGWGGGIHARGYDAVSAFITLVSNCVIAANYASQNAGGICFRDVCNLTVADCRIEQNTADGLPTQGRGAGIYFYPSLAGITMNVLLLNCQVKDNTCVDIGGGVYSGNNNILLFMRNCLIAGNECVNSGAGLNIYGQLFMTNCIVKDNLATGNASYGSGLYCQPGMPRVQLYNTLFSGNRGVRGGALRTGNLATGIYHFVNCTVVSNYSELESSAGVRVIGDAAEVVIWNSILYHNERAGVTNNYYLADNGLNKFYNSCTTPAVPSSMDGGGNIDGAPLFVDSVNQNFRLADQSPCINAGTNQAWMNGAVHLGGGRRIDRFDGVVDMGCYEYVRSGMMFYLH